MTEEKKTTKTKTTAKKSDEVVKFEGKYISAIGRRKTSVARIRLYKKGNGFIVVNDQKAVKYFTGDEVTLLRQPLKLTGQLRDLNISIVVKGGGKTGQAEAARHGIARALVTLDEEFKAQIKSKGWLTRDARKKERKKPGLKKARRAPQWSKR